MKPGVRWIVWGAWGTCLVLLAVTVGCAMLARAAGDTPAANGPVLSWSLVAQWLATALCALSTLYMRQAHEAQKKLFDRTDNHETRISTIEGACDARHGK